MIHMKHMYEQTLMGMTIETEDLKERIWLFTYVHVKNQGDP